jgi:hypothetical protein
MPEPTLSVIEGHIQILSRRIISVMVFCSLIILLGSVRSLIEMNNLDNVDTDVQWLVDNTPIIINNQIKLFGHQAQARTDIHTLVEMQNELRELMLQLTETQQNSTLVLH